MNKDKTMLETARMRGAVMEVIRCGRWRTTREIAERLPWAARNVWQRLEELRSIGAVENRKFYANPDKCTESQWRVSR